jgi:two-component system cell cycle sensor histidine kinase PleC
MARSFAAITPARAHTIQGIARSLAHPTYLKLADAEPWLRRIVPAMMVVFLIALASMAYLQSTSGRDETLNDAFGDIDVLASYLSAELGRRADGLGAEATATPDALEGVVPPHALRGQRFIILTNTEGAVVASLPSTSELHQPLNDILGPSQPLTTFADRAGVMFVTLKGDIPAIATVRNLPAPFGQVAVLQPVKGALAGWRARTQSFFLLVGAAGLVLSGISTAYFWQAWRARHADQICDRVRTRLDTALSRGRCGLWDWDIARGTIYWSDSMYEMLEIGRAHV